MLSEIARDSERSLSRAGRQLAEVFGELQRTIAQTFDSYRPELHYMRGPGPKWHAKHTRAGRLTTNFETTSYG